MNINETKFHIIKFEIETKPIIYKYRIGFSEHFYSSNMAIKIIYHYVSVAFLADKKNEY